MERKDEKHTRPEVIHSREPTAANIQVIESDEANPYAAMADKGHKVDPRAQKIFILCVILAVVFAVGLIIPESIFGTSQPDDYGISHWIARLRENVFNLAAVFTGAEGYESGVLYQSSKLLRFIIVALAGAGLGLTGAVYQGTLKNSLASPSTLGIMSGASLGAVVWVALFYGKSQLGDYSAYHSSAADSTKIIATAGGSTVELQLNTDPLSVVWSYYGLAICGFIGCLVVAGIILIIVRMAGRQKVSNIALVIIGSLVSATIGAVVSAIRYYYMTIDPWGGTAEMLKTVQAASFYRTFTWFDVLAIGVPLIAVFIVIMRLSPKLTLLTFSDEEARSMGVDSRRIKAVMLVITTLLVAIIISFCGTVGFVGFFVPHITRRLVGPTLRYQFPASMACGALFVLAAFVLMTVINDSYTTALGMFISIGGAAVFLITALRQKGGALRGDWQF